MDTRLYSTQEWEKTHVINAAITVALLKVYNASTIYQRFDALYLLIQTCDSHAVQQDAEAVQTLRAQALQFSQAIVDADNEEQLEKKFAARQKYKSIDPEYMPWHTPATRVDITKSSTRKEYVKNSVIHAFRNILHKRYSFVREAKAKFDVKEKVLQCSEIEREKYRIFPSAGKFKKITTVVTVYMTHLVLHHFDSENERVFDGKGKAIHVVSPKGDIFAGTTMPRVFHHSSFLAGAATISAGSIQSTVGQLQLLDDFSGHYIPQFQQALQTLTFFRKAKLLLKTIHYEMSDDNTMELTSHPVSSDATFERLKVKQ
jgi:hypothetical protein